MSEPSTGRPRSNSQAATTDACDAPRAKALPRSLPTLVTEAPALVPARMINEVHYCERLMYLEWSQGEFADNAFTVDGRAVHARADIASGALPPTAAKASEPKPPEVSRQRSHRSSPPPPRGSEAKGAPSSGNDDDRTASSSNELDDDDEPTPYVARSIWLSSERLGMTAKIDVVEGDSTGSVVPIEYKRSSAPDVPEGAFLPERAQVCAQVLLLREHGYECSHGEIYFARSRRRIRIEIDDELVELTRLAVQRIRELTSAGVLPPPLIDSTKCDGCSLVGICLPDETNLLRGEPSTQVGTVDNEADPIAEFWPTREADDDDESPQVVLRRLQPARDDRIPVYLQEQGAKVSLAGEELVIKGKEGIKRARLPNVSQVSVFGNVQLTTQVVRACLERGISITYLSTGGWFYGRATGNHSKNIELRVAQHFRMHDPETCLRLARGVIASKIRNCRTLLRRNHASTPDVTLFELEQLAKKAEQVLSLSSLLGLEGVAARSYFGAFSGMLKGSASTHFDLHGRNRRPPTDPINALLSLTYSLLTTEATTALASSGLDPLLGFYHQPRFGRPALALDIMEEFRPIIADSTVIAAVNNGVVSASDFVVHPTGVSLRPHARRRVLLAYERRLDQLVTHPVFGYRISYRRVLEVQSRLLGRFLLGEIDHYPSFRTR